MPPKVAPPVTLGPTLEARVAELLAGPDGAALARTLVETPSTTIKPAETLSPSSRGLGAVAALRALGGSLHGKISLHRTLGEGGMGIVHLATQATVGRHVAVKTLREGVASKDAALRILREAWVTGALEHPNVVPIYDVGVDESGAPIIVMKRIEGQSWSDLLSRHDIITERFLAADAFDWNLGILESVCNAVHFAHSRGILHRDLKPENVMIGAFGEVYVLDWGIAVSLHEDEAGRLPLASAATDVAGTPQYMAPEMLMGDPTLLSVRTDVYLLGAMLYEIFTGRPPHEGADVNALITHILVSPISFPDEMPEEVKDICAKAMSRDPAGRYESADAFRLAVDDYLGHRGSRKLAAEAKESHALLQEALAREPGEARAHEVARLLGECRFGYRAALSAWPDNTEAQAALDRALLEVVEYSLAEGEPVTGEALLREVRSKPPEVVQRVEAAMKARVAEDERLHRLEADFDTRIGTRTRSLLVGVFGLVWTTSPLTAWAYVVRHGSEPAVLGILAPLAFLFAGIPAYFWARESLTKTEWNRRLTRTVVMYLTAQCLLAIGAWFAGLRPHDVHLLSMFSWALLYAILAIWAEPWFGLVALTCTASFLAAAIFPQALFALMSFDNLVLTIVMVRVWLPKEDVARFRETGWQFVHDAHARRRERLRGAWRARRG